MLFDLGTLTQVHTVISLLGILIGMVVLVELLGIALPSWVGLTFLLLAILTSATGFLFPINGVLPSHVVGGVALIVLAVSLYARFVVHYAGAWRWIYAATMVASIYFLVFVGVAQMFTKIPAFQASAPTQSEPPFLIAQVIVLVAFLVLGVVSARRFQPGGSLLAMAR
jgi:hypothetical protein